MRTRPWAAIVRVPTSDGPVWFKESAPRLAFEPALTALVARTGHSFAPEVIAAEGACLLTRDAGLQLRDLDDGPPWEEIFRLYADLQLELVDVVGDALASGAPDKRPSGLPAAYRAALERTRLPPDLLLRLTRLEPRVEKLAEDVGDVVPVSLAHEEVHEGNVFVRDRPRLIDWGEACVGHPFAGTVNTIRSAVYGLDLEPGGAEVERLCDAYLQVWTQFAPLRELRRVLRPAYALGCLARVLLWDTILRDLPPERREGYDASIIGWLRLWADAAEGAGRIGELE